MTEKPVPEQAVLQSLRRSGLLGGQENARFEPLTGGVSSEIWRVTAGGRVFCVKRALSKLKVTADWFAPVERNRYEVAWYESANELVPGSAPRVLAHDDDAMLCAMEYMDPESHRLWKSELLGGRANPRHAAQTGTRLGRIHARAATSESIKARFPRADIFQDIRLEPYLVATAERHSNLEGELLSLSRRTAETTLTMIHGDVSPKNILLGPDGPVFLDAECACIGDPAFDIAFCLNHFLLKCLCTPVATNAFIDCFQEMSGSYLDEVTWESRKELEYRAATLLPALFLARVDGKSPVEYVTAEQDKERVRRCAGALLSTPRERLQEVAVAWLQELSL